MKALVSPLDALESERRMPDRYLRWGLLGRLVWLIARPTQRKAYRQLLRRQCQDRGPVPAELWKSLVRHNIALGVEEVLAEACWAERFSFHPNDPWLVIGEWETGDLSELDALFRIERKFGVELPRKQFAESVVAGLTFGDLVTMIEKVRHTSS